MNDVSMRLGKVLRLAREKAGLSQEGLAALANLNRSYLGEIERGEVEASFATVVKLAGALRKELTQIAEEFEKTSGDHQR